MPDLSEACIDEFDNVHYVKKVLSHGGQGIVYRSDPDVAIKFVIDSNHNEITSKEEVAYFQDKFRRVRLLPVPGEANITFPAALLSGRAGYVMTFLDDMRPVVSLYVNYAEARLDKDEKIPEWLSAFPDKKEAREIIAYCKTGGLRGRLLILYKISTQLALLHGAGLVYGDISCNNIFFSDRNEQYSVWLIDADNLKYEGEPGWVYTPGYGAPELARNIEDDQVILKLANEISDGTMASDCHAFAVLAHKMLTTVHPFLVFIVYGEGVDWADTDNDNQDPEKLAYMGKYPWIRDKDDDSNSSDAGLQPVLLYDSEIEELFQRTFSAGRKDPSERPVIFHWPYALARAADSTIQCPGCKMSYRYDSRNAKNGKEECPYCGEPKPAMIVMNAYTWENNALGKKQWTFARETGPSCVLTLPSRVFSLFSLTKSDIPVLEIDIQESSVLIKKIHDLDIEFSIASKNIEGGQFIKLLSQLRIKPPDGMIGFKEFHIFASMDGLSRMVVCTMKGSVK
jgi:serine/threonine protein kinase